MEQENFNKEKDTDARNIADLCLRCGQCCLAMATDFTHEELLEMTQKNEKEAQVFIEFFEKYENIAEVKKIAPNHVAQVLMHKGLSPDLTGDEAAFYYCKKITSDKKCSNHKQRPVCCAMAPRDGWSLMPPGCGYVGWQYAERERIKENVRNLKEKIYEIEVLEGEDAFVSELNMSLKGLKEYIEKKVKPFEKYGSKGW